MNILVIGNGFDKAFGLPTSYTDFLDAVKAINENAQMWWKTPKYKSIIISQAEHELFKAYLDNRLLQYFIELYTINEVQYNSPLWIDFEKELKYILRAIDNMYNEVGGLKPDYCRYPYPNHLESLNLKKYLFLGYLFSDNYAVRKQFQPNDIKERILKKSDVIKKIKETFDEFLILFEKYCELYIDTLDVIEDTDIDNFIVYKDGIVDIEQTFTNIKTQLQGILPLWGFDKVLTFNYTNTYQRVYVDNKEQRQAVTGERIDSQKEPEICYIHGKAGEHNIIIGIDEYLTYGKQNTDFDFIEFKKFYQRIDKRTGSTYKDWIKNPENKNVYYIGHSFAETDHDILREFLKDDNTHNTILYHEPFRKQELIQKVINIIGQDELIKRVHGSDWNIRFEPQDEFLFSKNNTVFIDAIRAGIESQLNLNTDYERKLYSYSKTSQTLSV
jgi:hypothetical protein